MPISPFLARMTVAGFFAVGGAIALNVLALQETPGAASAGRARADKARPVMDAERLKRLALDAIGGRDVTIAPAAPVVINAGEMPSMTHRIGSFSPSSGKLSQVALPGISPGEALKATIMAVQGELARRGYEPGSPDGAAGLVTRAAVLAYEYDQGLPLTADPSPEVLAHLRFGSSAPGIAVGLEEERKPRPGHADVVIRNIQQSLRQLGYLATVADGQVSEDTVRAIREFEMDTGLVPTGRISAPLVVRLAKQLHGRGRG